MPNSQDRQIIRKLQEASFVELNTDAIEKLLDDELSKPAEEMDVQFVQDLLNELPLDEPSASQRQKVWRNIQKNISEKPVRRHPLLVRFAAVAALITLLLGLMVGTAGAFRWTFLLKLLQPLGETFGIYMNYSDDPAPQTTTPAYQYAVSEDDAVSVMYDDLSFLPDSYDGYAIKPGWIPEGYQFAQGSVFSEINMQGYHLDYFRGTDQVNIMISIHTDPESVIQYAYEQSVGKTEERMIGECLVNFYTNANDKRQLISWIKDQAHYSIRGILTVEEIIRMVELYDSQLPE